MHLCHFCVDRAFNLIVYWFLQLLEPTYNSSPPDVKLTVTSYENRFTVKLGTLNVGNKFCLLEFCFMFKNYKTLSVSLEQWKSKLWSQGCSKD